jgi:hypothetical protein
MPKKKILTEDEVYKILKKFTIDCVHGGDFDQGQSEKDTLKITQDWWAKNKNKYSLFEDKENEEELNIHYEYLIDGSPF